jgi:hypothetical protein
VAPIADQRDAVAKAFFDVAVGQFDGRVEIFGISEFRPLEQQVWPLI